MLSYVCYVKLAYSKPLLERGYEASKMAVGNSIPSDIRVPKDQVEW